MNGAGGMWNPFTVGSELELEENLHHPSLNRVQQIMEHYQPPLIGRISSINSMSRFLSAVWQTFYLFHFISESWSFFRWIAQVDFHHVVQTPQLMGKTKVPHNLLPWRVVVGRTIQSQQSLVWWLFSWRVCPLHMCSYYINCEPCCLRYDERSNYTWFTTRPYDIHIYIYESV